MSSSLEILSNIVNNLTPGSELFVVVAVGGGVGGGTLVRGNILISVGEIIFVFLLNFVNSASHVSCKQIINTEHMYHHHSAPTTLAWASLLLSWTVRLQSLLPTLLITFSIRVFTLDTLSANT